MQKEATVQGVNPNPVDTTGLCLLSLDGGGVRGLSSLYILNNIMDQLNHARAEIDLPPVRPCDVFDLIGGTSTGGLIAIMLGRLEMDVDSCIAAYGDLAVAVFSKKLHAIPINFKGDVTPKFDSAKLERAIQKVIEYSGASEQDLFNDDSGSKNGTARGCRTFVCTADRYTNDIVRLRSYSLPHESNIRATICQAALATSAATAFFDPVSIGDRSFASGGLGANNPVNEVEGEASNIWCSDTGDLKSLVRCFISIGTGNPGKKPFENSMIKSLGQGLVQIATETEYTDRRFIARCAKHYDENQYFRFNVEQGLQEIGFEEYQKKEVMEVVTKGYLTHSAQKRRVRECIEKLTPREGVYPEDFATKSSHKSQSKDEHIGHGPYHGESDDREQHVAKLQSIEVLDRRCAQTQKGKGFSDLSGVNFSDILTNKSPEEHDSTITAATFTPDCEILASASVNGTIHLWETATGQCLHMFEGHGIPVTVATITSDGKILASASVNGTIQLWETVTGQCLYTLEGQDSTITAATFTPNCEILASASVNGTVQVWDTATGRCLHVLTGHDSPVTAATFISDGKILASASVNGTIRLWDITTGQCLYTLEGQDNPITVATFTPDCEVLASASVNGTVQVWDTSTGRCLHVLTGHDRTVIAAAFTPDGKILASVSVNGTIQLWETATGQCLYTLEGHQNSVIAASFTPNGKKLALASVNGTVQLRETVTGKLEYMQRLTLLNYHKIELRVKWDVPEAMRLYKKGTRFSSILTITGNKVDAQAATCESYLNEHFKTGPTLLHIIQEAWDSKASSNTKSSEGDLQYLSIKIDGLEHENAVAIVSGTVEMIREVIHAFAWFCCAMRPAPSHNFSLSTFSFDLHATMEERCPKVTLEFNLLRQDAGSEDCCWQGLFRKANIISDAPISDRTQFGQLRGEQSVTSMPHGLEIPFQLMVDLAAVGFPFEYDNGIILKGFSTLLVVTAKWISSSGNAFQWHMKPIQEDIDLSELSEKTEYQAWRTGESPPPVLKTVEEATRTFLGWSDAYKNGLTAVDSSNVDKPDLESASKNLKLKILGFNISLGKAPFILAINAAVNIEDRTVRYDRESEFHEMIGQSITSPVLLYAPDERRGWLVPRISVLECMAAVNIQVYGFSVSAPEDSLKLDETKKKLLEVLQHTALRSLLSVNDTEEARTNTFRLRELLINTAHALRWAEERARHQHRLDPRRWRGDDTIYGLEFYKIALRDEEHDIKKCIIERPHGNWVQLVNRAIKGVIFCKGLGEVVVGQGCAACQNVPQQRSYMVAVISCLEYLRMHDRLDAGFNWKFNSTAFEKNPACSSFENHLQKMGDEPPNATSPSDYQNGVVVFGGH